MLTPSQKLERSNLILIILDYSMRVMNVIDAGAALQAMLPEVPIILFAGKNSYAIASAAIYVGMCAVVPEAGMGELHGSFRTLID